MVNELAFPIVNRQASRWFLQSHLLMGDMCLVRMHYISFGDRQLVNALALVNFVAQMPKLTGVAPPRVCSQVRAYVT